MHLLCYFHWPAGEEKGASCSGADFSAIWQRNVSQLGFPSGCSLQPASLGEWLQGLFPQKDSLNPIACPWGLYIRTWLCPAHLCCRWLKENVVDRVSDWIRSFCLSFASCFRWSGDVLQGTQSRIRVQLFCISPCEFPLDQETGDLRVSTGCMSASYLTFTWLFQTPSQI